MARTTRPPSSSGPTPSTARRALVGELRSALADVHKRVADAADRAVSEADETDRLLKSKEVRNAARENRAMAARSKELARIAKARRQQAAELRELSTAVDELIARDLDALTRTLLR